MTAINRFTVCIVSSLSTITFTFNMICIILKKKGINLGTRRKVVEMTRDMIKRQLLTKMTRFLAMVMIKMIISVRRTRQRCEEQE